MPRLSIWFVRASLIYLVVGLTLGALLLANEGVPFSPAIGKVLPVHIELLLLGWLVQLAMGAAYWVLPRFSSGPPRGNQGLAWLSFFVLNAGLWLVVFASLTSRSWVLLIGRLIETTGVAIFAWGTWRRAKPAGK